MILVDVVAAAPVALSGDEEEALLSLRPGRLPVPDALPVGGASQLGGRVGHVRTGLVAPLLLFTSGRGASVGEVRVVGEVVVGPLGGTAPGVVARGRSRGRGRGGRRLSAHGVRSVGDPAALGVLGVSSSASLYVGVVGAALALHTAAAIPVLPG